MKQNKNNYWVGKFTSGSGQIVVYDPTLQPDGSQTVYLYNLSKLRLEPHDKDQIRGNLTKISKENAGHYAIRAYESWRKFAGAKIAKDGIANYAQILNHEEIFDTRRRITHCWKCKTGLDNNYNIECKKCSWIICPVCGACSTIGC